MDSKRTNSKTRKNEGRSQSLCTEAELKEIPRDAFLEKNSQSIQPNKNLGPIPPDGGWGWLVAFGGCCNHCLAATLVPTYSLIFSSFFAQNDVSSTTATWIFNLNQCLWNASIFLGGQLCSWYGWRKVAFCGGLCLSVSVIISGFVTRPEWLFLTFSLFTGAGQGMCVLISFVVVAHYFDKRKGIATGMVSAGNCLGQFLGPLMARFLIEQFGRQGTILVMGGILLHTCAIALLFHPVEWHSKTNKLKNKDSNDLKQLLNSNISPNSKCEANKVDSQTTEDTEEHSIINIKHPRKLSLRKESFGSLSLDKISAVLEKSSSFYLSISSQVNNHSSQTTNEESNQDKGILRLLLKNILLLKWYRVQVMTLSMALAVSSYVNFIMVVPFAMSEKGYSLEIISWSLSVAGICNLIARIVITALTDFVSFSTKYFFMMGSFGIFLSIIIFTMVSSSKMVLLTMCLFGMSVGTCICLLSIISLEYMELKFLPSLLGLTGLLTSVFFLILGSIVGAVRDTTKSYFITLQVLSIAPLLSLFLWILMPCALSMDKQRENNEKYLNNDASKVPSTS